MSPRSLVDHNEASRAVGTAEAVSPGKRVSTAPQSKPPGPPAAIPTTHHVPLAPHRRRATAAFHAFGQLQ